jgi:hypothetical protein
MSEKRTRTRVRCLVDELPEDVRAEVDELLADTSNGYVAISAWLAQQGYNISKSSVGRYAQRNGKLAQRLREIREQAQEYARLIEENQEMDIAKVASTIYLQNLMRRVVEAGDDEYGTIELKDAGDQISRLLRTHVYEGRYAQQRQGEIEKATELVLQQLRAELVNDPDTLAAIQRKVQESRQRVAADQGGVGR